MAIPITCWKCESCGRIYEKPETADTCAQHHVARNELDRPVGIYDDATLLDKLCDRVLFPQDPARLWDDCWIWSGAIDRAGYPKMPISASGRHVGGGKHVGGKRASAHRISYYLSTGDHALGLFVHHACDNPLCVNPLHLDALTPAGNIQDAAAKGIMSRSKRRLCRGHKHGISRLDDDKVSKIDAGLKAGKSQAALAIEYGVSRAAIEKIAHGDTWGWLTGRGKE
jgi:hypothetical protein